MNIERQENIISDFYDWDSGGCNLRHPPPPPYMRSKHFLIYLQVTGITVFAYSLSEFSFFNFSANFYFLICARFRYYCVTSLIGCLKIEK
jgi:hypothetical protein